MWIGTSLVVLLAVKSALAIVDPTAPATPCVSSRVVSPRIQADIAEGCEDATDITAAVCADYLAQEILAAQNYYCGNQSEAFSYCNSLPAIQPGDCIYFDPTGGDVAANCSDYTLDQYNSCGTNYLLFTAGDLVSLAQCVFFGLGLCVPEDGVGHYDTVPFQGASTDCPIPAYTPACGACPPSGCVPTDTPSTTSMTSPTWTAYKPLNTSNESDMMTSTTVSPGTITTYPTLIATGPTAPPCSPSDSPPFYIVVNGNFSQFLDPYGGITTNQSQAETFFIAAGELFTSGGLHVQAGQVDNTTQPYIIFVGLNSYLPLATTFCLITQDTSPLPPAKRQAVGLTVLYWINNLFQAPTTSASFCIYNEHIYAILQSGGPDANFYAQCVTVTLSALDCDACLPLTSPTSSGIITTALAASSTSTSTKGALAVSSCPIGQMLVAYTTVYLAIN